MIKITSKDITAWLAEGSLVVIGILHPTYLPEVVPLLVTTFLGHGLISNQEQNKTVN